MEKINTIGKTITGLSNEEFDMIIRALEARYRYFQDKVFYTQQGEDVKKIDLEVSHAYKELAKLVKSQKGE